MSTKVGIRLMLVLMFCTDMSVLILALKGSGAECGGGYDAMKMQDNFAHCASWLILGARDSCACSQSMMGLFYSSFIMDSSLSLSLSQSVGETSVYILKENGI